MRMTRFVVIFISISITTSYLACQTEVLFSPIDKPTKRLLELIQESKKQIHAAVYMITDKVIAEALIEAKINRGVDVQIITDKMTYESSFGKGQLLIERGVPLFIYHNPPTKKNVFFATGPIMHHKFVLFDDVKLWTGSFNWTVAANRSNQENVIITDEKNVCTRFKNCFEQLKSFCTSHPYARGKNQEAPSAEKAPTLDTLIQMIKGYFRLPRTA